jgi:hypothetical protein
MSDKALRHDAWVLRKANLVACRLVKVVRFHALWAISLDGWHICGYDAFRTQAEAAQARVTFIQHLDVALYRAGVK